MAKTVTSRQAEKEAASQMNKKSVEQKSEEFRRFEDFTRRLMAVPMKEIDAEKAE